MQRMITARNLLIIILANLGAICAIWLPHFLKLNNLFGLDFSTGIDTLYRNFDGLEYVVIAKSLYNPAIINQIPFHLDPSYYAAHFPGYALAILALSPLLGFLKSMVAAAMIFTILANIAFYFLVKDFKLTSHPLLLSLIFIVLPARWLIVHSVGSAEPMFIFFVILSIYSYLKFEQTQNFTWIVLTGVWGLLTQLTRPPGILLFFALGAAALWNVYKRGGSLKSKLTHLTKYLPLVLIPLTLLGIFLLYFLNMGDFWGYFHSGDNIHLAFPPFQVFNKSQAWVGDIWLEDIVYILLLGLSGGIVLWRKRYYSLASFTLVYLVAISLVAHRDISRYSLPVFPFVLIAFEKFLTSKEFKIALVILLLGIYLYSQNFILANTAPIPDLSLLN